MCQGPGHEHSAGFACIAISVAFSSCGLVTACKHSGPLCCGWVRGVCVRRLLLASHIPFTHPRISYPPPHLLNDRLHVLCFSRTQRGQRSGGARRTVDAMGGSCQCSARSRAGCGRCEGCGSCCRLPCGQATCCWHLGKPRQAEDVWGKCERCGGRQYSPQSREVLHYIIRQLPPPEQRWGGAGSRGGGGGEGGWWGDGGRRGEAVGQVRG